MQAFTLIQVNASFEARIPLKGRPQLKTLFSRQYVSRS